MPDYKRGDGGSLPPLKCKSDLDSTGGKKLPDVW